MGDMRCDVPRGGAMNLHQLSVLSLCFAVALFVVCAVCAVW